MQCDECGREGKLTHQFVMESKKFGITPFVMRYYLCQWHRAAHARASWMRGKKLAILTYISDEELLKEYERERAIKNSETACV